VIVLIIDKFRVAVIECESQSPVSADTHAPVVRKLPLEGVQSPARDVHIRRLSDHIERCQLPRQSRRVRSLDACFAAGPEKPFDSFVTKRSYHGAIVARGATHHKAKVPRSMFPRGVGAKVLVLRKYSIWDELTSSRDRRRAVE